MSIYTTAEEVSALLAPVLRSAAMKRQTNFWCVPSGPTSFFLKCMSAYMVRFLGGVAAYMVRSLCPWGGFVAVCRLTSAARKTVL